MSKIRVGLVFGGNSAEHTVSIMSAVSVWKAIDREKFEVVPMAISKQGYWLGPEKSTEFLKRECQLVDDIFTTREQSLSQEGNKLFSDEVFSLVREGKLDAVFPVLHGPFGEDGKIQGFWEMLGIPYVGTGVLSSALIMDKVFQKKIFAYHQLPQAGFLSFDLRKQNDGDFDKIVAEIADKFGFPCFVKPANMGSSIGISRVESSSELKNAFATAFEYDRKLVVEEYIAGREIECSVLGEIGSDQPYRVSLPGEIKPAHDFYDYQSKYEDRDTELVIPVELPERICTRIQQLAVKSFEIMEGCGMCRVDFFYREEDEGIFINELNTIPGFTKYSMYPKLWSASGMEYSDLITELISLALQND